ncbi:armadillo-type protein [Flammula alnicola]|nr:armadillo-type protein [Flammula alnicola]
MDVPFHSSGAMSRAHYAIVRKVESSTSVQSADQHIFLEIKSVQMQLSRPKLSLEKCKECLVILLYCSTSVTPGFLAADAFDFSFHHAINLAETGKKVEDKRIGYLFCSEIMPLDTSFDLCSLIPCDLESDEVPRLCLALDNLITSPTEDIIPAVQSQLHDLLSHDYSQVRRRALLAFRALSSYNPALLERIRGTILKRLSDADSSVVQAALVLARDVPSIVQDNAIVARVNDILVAESSYVNDTDQDIILSVLKALGSLGLSEANIPLLLDILQEHSEHKDPTSLSKAVILEIFHLFSQLKSDAFLSAEISRKISSIQCIRQFLMSYSPNDVHLFVSCLERVDVAAWAGTTPNRAAVLEGPEFQRIMQLLDSIDQGIRKTSLRIIKKVDPSILDAHVLSLIKGAQPEPANMDTNESLMRILETRLIQYEEDGGEYARQVLELTRKVDEGTTVPLVFKGIIETVLTDIRSPSNSDFLPSCATHFITVLSEPEVPLSPTALVIATALATEFSGSLPTSPVQILSGLAARLKTCLAIVQEPCVIAMLRVRADCDEIPSDVMDTVTTLARSARRSIRVRCTQFLEFSKDKELLVKIIREASSPSLPDFLASLQNYKADSARSSASTPQFSRASSRAAGPSSSSLKYAAYALPEVIPPLRMRRMSSSSSRSGTLSDPDRHHSSMSPPMTAGHLALAVGMEDLRIRPSAEHPIPSQTEELRRPDIQKTPGVDLITLESPFEEDSTSLNSSETIENKPDFEEVWHTFDQSCDLRGWCNSSIDIAIRRLQRVDHHRLRVVSVDLPPFIGELKILMEPNEDTHTAKSSKPELVALRLRESEEDSCLWRLRCADVEVGTQIQNILNT